MFTLLPLFIIKNDMTETLRIVLIGNFVLLFLLICPHILSIIFSSGFLESECPGALVRPSYWLMTNGCISIFLWLLSTVIICVYLIVGKRFLFWGYVGSLGLVIIWFICWNAIVGTLNIAFRADKCDQEVGNYPMVVVTGFIIVYNVIVAICMTSFMFVGKLFVRYRQLAEEEWFMPF
jgi:hypothetical protein